MALDQRYKAVCFDMDGTFMNTKIDYAKLAGAVHDELINIGVPEWAIVRTEGAKGEFDSGTAWLIKNGREDDVSRLHKRVSKHFTVVEMEHMDISRPFEGAVEAVEAIRRKGYRTGILTRGGRAYAEQILRRSNVLGLFDALVARDDFPDEESKPSPKAMENIGRALGVRPEEILYLGDHKIDWLTARDSGAGFIGVLTGGYGIDDWNALDANIAIIDGVASLLKMIE